MQIKQAILPSEKKAVEDFLSSFNLRYLRNADYTAYAQEGDEIIGTVSLAKNVISDLAVSKEYQGENLSTILISHAIAKLREENVYSYKVFTKPEHLDKFLNLGFSLLLQTEDFIALEGGESNIHKTLSNLKTKIKMDLGSFDGDYGAIVMNANPFTLGHLALIEHALKKHAKVLLFILEEDVSEFSFKERFSLAFLATRQYRDRVCVLPSTDYVVSKATFPDYFIHGIDKSTKAYAQYDAGIFEKYFMNELNISCRYLGEEEKDYMLLYNDSLKTVLKNRAEIVQRYQIDGQTVSASKVREFLKKGDIANALTFIPTSCKAVFNMIAGTKQW